MRGYRPYLSSSLIIAVSLLLITAYSSAVNEGVFSFPDPYGESVYRLVLDFPREVRLGEPFNMTATVYVEKIGGLKLYNRLIALTIILMTEDGRVVAQEDLNTMMDEYYVQFVYEGYRWGPFTIPITIDKGGYQDIEGKIVVRARLEVDEWAEDRFGYPTIRIHPRPKSVMIGSLTLLEPQSPPSLELGAVAAAIAAASLLIYLNRRKPSRKL